MDFNKDDLLDILNGKKSLRESMNILGYTDENYTDVGVEIEKDITVGFGMSLILARMAYDELVRSSFIDGGRMYNLGAHGKSIEPSHGDIGFMGVNTFLYRFGKWTNINELK